MDELPVIDVSALVGDTGDTHAVAAAIDAACREVGFFYVTGHGVPEALQERLEELSRSFFALPTEQKAAISMASGGRAWRGWFPLEGELTAGRPDRKEGVYFGAELPLDDERVRAGWPLHGPNRFPAELPELRSVVPAYLDALTQLGHALVRGISLGLGLPDDWFDRHLTADPLVLFRIFRYPPSPPSPPNPDDAEADTEAATPGWGVAEHTDYGLLTILRQDRQEGLQVHSRHGWVDAPPRPGTFVCNLGDMLERITAGRYRSTPHRVGNTTGVDRLSFPFFFDPGWEAEVVPVPHLGERPADARARWDGEDVFAAQGTYGDYLLSKVGRVFPDLKAEVLEP